MFGNDGIVTSTLDAIWLNIKHIGSLLQWPHCSWLKIVIINVIIVCLLFHYIDIVCCDLIAVTNKNHRVVKETLHLSDDVESVVFC